MMTLTLDDLRNMKFKLSTPENLNVDTITWLLAQLRPEILYILCLGYPVTLNDMTPKMTLEGSKNEPLTLWLSGTLMV